MSVPMIKCIGLALSLLIRCVLMLATSWAGARFGFFYKAQGLIINFIVKKEMIKFHYKLNSAENYLDELFGSHIGCIKHCCICFC